jgi:5-methylcytosine-specific restriction endonuclease McrA
MVGRDESEVANKFSLYMHLEMRRGVACYHCGATRQGGSSHERDHVVPKAHGGSDAESNVVNACRSRNQNKGSQPVDDFRERIKNRRKIEDALRFWGFLRQKHLCICAKNQFTLQLCYFVE